MSRRLVVTTAIATLFLCLSPAVALAQRDPFDPLVDPDAATAGGTTTTTTTAGDTEPGGVPGTGPETDGLPNTGSDAAPWLVLAYALLAGGAGAVALSRCFGVQPGSGSSRR